MQVDKRVIDPFNKWWRGQAQHCEAEPRMVAAFAAGFKAGMERAVAEMAEIIKRPAQGTNS
jgi:hypothetical protein